MSNRWTFDVGAFLKDQGLKLVGVDEKGQHRVATPDGTERTLEVEKMLQDLGVPSDKINLQFNTPDDSLDVSPVSIPDRMKMAFGNTKGKVGYLKNKFEDVMVHPDNGLVVKNKGVWQKVDAGSLDPWELSADIAEGVISMAPGAIGSTIGALAGAAAGAGLGGVVGAGVGGVVGAGVGGGAAEAGRIRLGRYFGTYDATPEEQLKDIGFEALLNSGGQLVAAGVRPTVVMLKEAAKKINKHAAPASKEIMSSVYGSLTGAGQTSTRVLIEMPEDTAREISKALDKSGRDSVKALDALKTEQIEDLTRVLKDARPALRNKFQKLEDEFLKVVPKDLEIDIAGFIRNAQTAMQKAGIGQFVEEEQAVSKLLGASGKPISKTVPRFKLFDANEIEQAIANGGLPDTLSKPALKALGDFVEEMNKFSRMPVKRGEEAAKAALKVKRTLSNAFFSITEKEAPTVRQALAQFSSGLDDSLKGVFSNHPKPEVRAAFDLMNSTYKRYADVVKEAERVLEGFTSPEVLVNKLISNPGSHGTAKGFRDLLEELVDDNGKRLLKGVMVKEGAKGHIRFFPNPSKMTPIIGGVATTAATMAGAIAPGTAIVAASQASPRLVMKQVQYGSKLLQFLQGLPEKELIKWLRNPALVDATIRTAFTAAMKEEEDIEALLTQAGVK